MGAAHFLTKTLPHVRTEMSLHVPAYNLKRAINLLGAIALMRAMKRLSLNCRAMRMQIRC
jgi:hypothetical protein